MMQEAPRSLSQGSFSRGRKVSSFASSRPLEEVRFVALAWPERQEYEAGEVLPPLVLSTTRVRIVSLETQVASEEEAGDLRAPLKVGTYWVEAIESSRRIVSRLFRAVSGPPKALKVPWLQKLETARSRRTLSSRSSTTSATKCSARERPGPFFLAAFRSRKCSLARSSPRATRTLS